MVRIGELRFYEENPAKLAAAVSRLATLDVSFLVLGRVVGNRFISLDDIKLPTPLRALCQGVPESVYRNDISSTRIRAKRQLNRPDSQE